MARKVPQRGPTREQLTDQQFACVCRAFDILHEVWLRMERKKEMEAVHDSTAMQRVPA